MLTASWQAASLPSMHRLIWSDLEQLSLPCHLLVAAWGPEPTRPASQLCGADAANKCFLPLHPSYVPTGAIPMPAERGELLHEDPDSQLAKPSGHYSSMACCQVQNSVPLILSCICCRVHEGAAREAGNAQHVASLQQEATLKLTELCQALHTDAGEHARRFHNSQEAYQGWDAKLQSNYAQHQASSARVPQEWTAACMIA